MSTDVQTPQKILEQMCEDMLMENSNGVKRGMLSEISYKMIKEETLDGLSGPEKMDYLITGQNAFIKTLLAGDHYSVEQAASHALWRITLAPETLAIVSENNQAKTYLTNGLNAPVALLAKTENNDLKLKLATHICDVASNEGVIDALAEQDRPELAVSALGALVKAYTKIPDTTPFANDTNYKARQKKIVQNFLTNKTAVTALGEEAMEKEGLLSLAGKTGSELEIYTEIVGAFAANKGGATQEKYCTIAGLQAAKLDEEFIQYMTTVTTLRHVKGKAIADAEADFKILDALSTKLKPPAPVFPPLA